MAFVFPFMSDHNIINIPKHLARDIKTVLKLFRKLSFDNSTNVHLENGRHTIDLTPWNLSFKVRFFLGKSLSLRIGRQSQMRSSRSYNDCSLSR